MIENLKDELDRGFLSIRKKTQAKGDKLCANIKQELEGQKSSNTFSKVLEIQNMQTQTIFELYTDDNKSIYPSNPKDILKSGKEFMKNSTPTEAVT